jgi:hypothetical protein
LALARKREPFAAQGKPFARLRVNTAPALRIKPRITG